MKLFAMQQFALVSTFSVCAAVSGRAAMEKPIKIYELSCQRVLAMQKTDQVAVLAWLQILPPDQRDMAAISPDRIDQAAIRLTDYCQDHSGLMLWKALWEVFQIP